MLLSLNWLKDFVEIPRSISPEKLGLLLTMHTVEIDSVENQVEKYKGVAIGKILKISKHPNADRLQLVQVDMGKEVLNIICGAQNIEKGQLVPIATVGAVLPSGLEIKETEVRGEKSMGMLCAEDELGLGEDHSGIMILGKKAKIGQSFGEFLKLRDIIYEVDNKSITNRPDLWCHYGMSREISVFLDVKFKKNWFEDLNKQLSRYGRESSKKVELSIEDFSFCSRYMAVKISDIKIKESPKWIQERLIAVGMRPLNNIVDITNYAMLELGQPLHAFDASKVDKIIVRKAKEGEKISTLDNQERELKASDLVIADSQKAIAIAGIMGGSNSEVDENTKEIIIESANFDYSNIRKTSQRLGLRTEASMRFEKSIDPNLCALALSRVIELIKADQKKAFISSEIADVKKFSLNQGPIELDLDWLQKSIGEKIENKFIISTLEKLGFELKKDENKISVIAPSWRVVKDISIKEDIVEEIVRIKGYDNLDAKMPNIEMKSPEKNLERNFERKIKNLLAIGAGLSEVYNYSFVGEEQLSKLSVNFSQYLKLANPIVKQHTLLRQHLAPNLIENIKLNQPRFEEIKLFEIGSAYFDFPGEIKKDNDFDENLPFQEKRLGIAIAGNNKNVVFDELKGVIKYLMDDLNINCVFEIGENYPVWADPVFSVRIIAGLSEKKDIGYICLLNSDNSKKAGLKKEAVISEIIFADLFKISLMNAGRTYQAPPKYPPLARDLAFVVDNKILYNNIKREIEEFDKLIREVELFDAYQDKKLGKNKKSLAFHLNYQSSEKTLTAEEVDKIQKELVKTLEEKFEARIRDF